MPTPIVAPASLSKPSPAAARGRAAPAGAAAAPPAALAELQETLKTRDAAVTRLEKELEGVKVELAAAAKAMRGNSAKAVAKALDFEGKLEPFLESLGWTKGKMEVKRDGKMISTIGRVSVLKFIGQIVSARDEAQLEVIVRRREIMLLYFGMCCASDYIHWLHVSASASACAPSLVCFQLQV